MEVTCLNCGRTFQRSPSLVKKKVFCSKECRSQYARRDKVCVGCGKTFQRHPKKPGNQYCSWECFKQSRHVTLTCAVCGKEFDSYLSEARKREARNHVACCSRACRNVYTSLLLGGDGEWVEGGKYNPKRQRGYKWRPTRQVYLESVGGICESCGAAPAVEVHHLVPTAMGGSLLDFDNLMAVCAECHKMQHDDLRDGIHDWELWDYFNEQI